MEHELFRHVEIELFVTQSRLREAVKYIREVIEVFADTTEAISTELGEQLDNVGWRSALEESRGSFTHHYPICFRLVLPDDTMLSMASGTGEPYYAISFISYPLPLEPFEGLATFLAGSMAALFDARPHWGKYFPLSGDTVQKLYPELGAFRDLCLAADPLGVFRNPFVDRALGFDRATATRSTGDSVS